MHESLHIVLETLLAGKEIKYQDKYMNDIVIRLFNPHEVMLRLENEDTYRANSLTVGRKIGKGNFVPVKMDLCDFLNIPQHMTMEDLVKLTETPKQKKTDHA